MILDPEDIEYCEKHECNFMAGDECHKCADERDAWLVDRVIVLESFLRGVLTDGGASKNLKDIARELVAEIR